MPSYLWKIEGGSGEKRARLVSCCAYSLLSRNQKGCLRLALYDLVGNVKDTNVFQLAVLTTTGRLRSFVRAFA